MRLYRDDDSAGKLLVRTLRARGHDILTPTDTALVGAADAVHFRHALREGRVLLSRDYEDFKNLHDLVVESGGHHPGLLIVRRDNDPRRDMKAAGIARALENLMAAGMALPDQYVVLNHWR